MYDTTIIQTAMQPFQKLAQANMELFTKFSISPEVTSQAMSDAQKIFQQTQDSALKLAQSQAFASMMQGCIQNYTDFLTELSQNVTSIASQGQAAFMKQAADSTSRAIEATPSGARRLRTAA